MTNEAPETGSEETGSLLLLKLRKEQSVKNLSPSEVLENRLDLAITVGMWLADEYRSDLTRLETLARDVQTLVHSMEQQGGQVAESANSFDLMDNVASTSASRRSKAASLRRLLEALRSDSDDRDLEEALEQLKDHFKEH